MRTHFNTMKYAACAVLAAAAAARLPAVEIDGVAAVVGKATILKSDVKAEMARHGVSNPSLYGEYLDRLIERELILKAAGSSKMKLQDWAVENRIKAIIDDAFDGDRNKLVDTLARSRIPYGEWSKRVREDLLVQMMTWDVVTKNLRASPMAMRKEYESHPERYRRDVVVDVAVILLKPGDADKRADVEKTIAEEGFGEAAKKYSADAKASEGGVWKNARPREVFRPELCDELDRTPPGTVSAWVELDGWSFLMRKESESAGGTLSFSEAYSAIEKNVKDDLAKKLHSEWIGRLKDETFVRKY